MNGHAPISGSRPSVPRTRVGGRPVRRRYHFHWPGLLYAAVTAALAIGAIKSQNNLLFLALGLALGGLLVSGIISGLSLMGLRLERLPTPDGRAGEPLHLRYRIGNASRLLPAFGLTVEEVPPKARRREPEPAPAFALYVAARAALGVSSTLIPQARGRLELDAIRVWSTFPFGLAKKSILFRQPQSVLIAPPRLVLREAAVRGLLGRSGEGPGSANAAGAGDEPFGVREFLPGDNPKRIAWKPSARFDRPILRQQAMPASARVWIVIRLAPEPDEAADETAIAFAAALLGRAASTGAAVGLAIPAQGIIRPPRSGQKHADRLVAELSGLDLNQPALDRRGQRFPAAATRSGECIVVHAGPPGRAFGPPHARHVGSAELPAYVEPGPAAQHALALLGRPSQGRDDAAPRHEQEVVAA